MTVMWMIIGCLLALVWAITLVDIFRRRYSAWTTIGYVALVVLLPFIGTAIYWVVRKPTAAELEHIYRAETDLERSPGSRPFDSTRI
jgi:amino acid transporter